LRARDLRNMNEEELQTKLAETRKELFNLRFQEAIGSLENTTRLRIARREIARIMTVQQEQAQAAKAQV
jgi:large subunit ribosomal protein L29